MLDAIVTWLKAKPSLFALGALVGAVLIWGFDIADKALKMTDRSGWTKSEALGSKLINLSELTIRS